MDKKAPKNNPSVPVRLKDKDRKRLLQENSKLKIRLAETKKRLNALKTNSINTLLTDYQKIFALMGVDSLYRVIVDTISEGAFILTVEGMIIYCNNALARMLKLPLDKIIGNSILDFTDLTQRSQLRLLLRKSRLKTAHGEFIFRKRNKASLPVFITCNHIATGSESICVTVTDLTRQKRTERLLVHYRRRFKAVVQARAKKISESKQRLYTALEAGRMFAFEWNPQADKIIRSPHCAKILGLKSRELKSSSEKYFKLIHPQDRERFLKILYNLTPENNTYIVSYRVKNKDRNQYVFLGEKGEAVFDKQGKMVRLSGLAADITARKQVEEKLQESEKRLALATVRTGIGIFDRNIITGDILATEQNARLLGLCTTAATTTMLTQRYRYSDWAKCVHVEDLPRVEKEMNNSMEKGTSFESEYRVIWPDGSVHWLAARGTFQYDAEKRPQRLLGVLMDITKRKQAEIALQQSEARYRILFGSIDEAFCTIKVLFDENGKAIDYQFLSINPSFEKQTGIKNAVGRRMREIAPLHEEYWFQIYGQVAMTGEPVRFQNMAEQLGRFYDVYAFRVGAAAERKVAILFNDITARKQAEEILKRDKDMLEKLVNKKTSELIKVYADLQRSKRLSDIGMLAATVAHELRNPLAAIGMAAYNLKRKTNNPKINTHLKNINKKIEESDQIINNLLFYSRIKQPCFKKIKLFNVIKESFKNRYKNKKKLAIIMDIGSLKNILIEADPFQMKELFSNILNNSIDVVPNRGAEIKVHSVVKDGFIDICIEDNGPGFNKEIAGRVFDPFFTTKAKGTGLGLFVCRQIAAMHNGEIGIKNNTAGGACVYIRLPRQREGEVGDRHQTDFSY